MDDLEKTVNTKFLLFPHQGVWYVPKTALVYGLSSKSPDVVTDASLVSSFEEWYDSGSPYQNVHAPGNGLNFYSNSLIDSFEFPFPESHVKDIIRYTFQGNDFASGAILREGFSKVLSYVVL